MRPDDHPLLAGASPESQSLILEAPVRRFVDRDKLLGHENSPRAVYAILDGRVRIEINGVRISERHEGEVVGEQAFIDRRPHSADVVADGDVRAIELAADRLERILPDPAVARTLLQMLSGKLREATGDRYKRYGERDRLFAFSGQFVDPLLRDEMLERGEDFARPRLVRNVIVMFTDARGFTATSEGSDPMELAAEIGEYVSSIGDVLRSEGALVDKFIGDGVMAFWGYPGLRHPDAAVALRAAKQILAISPLHRLGGRPAQTGIGIHVGDAFMGNVGSDEKKQFTILGNVVNLAARFEGQTKVLAGDIVCSSRFYDALGAEDRQGFNASPQVEIHGSSVPLDLFVYRDPASRVKAAYGS